MQDAIQYDEISLKMAQSARTMWSRVREQHENMWRWKGVNRKGCMTLCSKFVRACAFLVYFSPKISFVTLQHPLSRIFHLFLSLSSRLSIPFYSLLPSHSLVFSHADDRYLFVRLVGREWNRVMRCGLTDYFGNEVHLQRLKNIL